MAVKIDPKDYKLEDIESKYTSFYEPNYDILIEGTSIKTVDAMVEHLNVDTSTTKADSFTFHVFNAYNYKKRKFNWADKFFSPGRSIEIKMGYGETLETIFEGNITSVSFQFSESDCPIIVVSGMDISFKMMKGTKSFSWDKKRYSDVVREIAANYTSQTVIDNTEITYEAVEQSRTSDYQFITWMAERSNFEFFVTGKNLFFRKPHKNKKPEVELEIGNNMISLEINQDIGEQVGSVTVRGWNSKKKEEFQQKVQDVDKLGPGKDGAAIIRELVGASTTEYYYSNEESGDDAQKMAGFILNKAGMKLVGGRGEWLGIPEIMAGKYLKLSGAGANLDKLYYITSATHIMDEDGYRTSFELGGNEI